jgi:endogenous inhibitor of DNA gyrase (YacG/DUF329 family)
MTASLPTESQPARIVKCPTCGGTSVYAPSNVFRPFCCERCKQVDLGAWASEQFAVPAPAGPDPLSSDDQ